MTWTAHLVRTMDGTLGAEIPFSEETGTWDIPINGVESWDISVPRDRLRQINPQWWHPWRASVLMSWRNSEGRLVPWLFGPIVNLPEEDKDSDMAKLPCKGLLELLERRVVTDQEYSPMQYNALAKSRLHRQGLSYGAIAQDIVKAITDNRIAGELPISYGSARESGSTLFTRSYAGYNVANNDAKKLITALTEVQQGPDIMFRPRFANTAQTRVEWQMVHGTVKQRSIAQDWSMDLDTRSSRSVVSTVSPKNDSSGLFNRVYWTGAGEDEGTLIRISDNYAQKSAGMPLMELVGSDSDSDSASLIQGRADTAIEEGKLPLQQLTVEIDGADPRAEIGRWHVGDRATLTIGDDWLTVAPGTRLFKIIAAKGSWDQTVTLEFQEGYL